MHVPIPAEIEDSLQPQERDLVGCLLEAISEGLDERALRNRGEEGLREIVLQTLPLFRVFHGEKVQVRLSDPEGSRAGRTVIEILTPDSPFLVDTLRLNRRRLRLRELLMLHPVVGVERSADGAMQRVAKDVESREAFLYLEVPRIADTVRRIEIEQELTRVFTRVHDVVADHARMVRALRRHMAEIEYTARVLEGGEERARKLIGFLDWLAEDNYLFLGYRHYRVSRDAGQRAVRVDATSALGLLRDVSNSRFREMLHAEELPALVRSRLTDERLVFFDKSRHESTIHRAGRLDCVSIKTLDEHGAIVGYGSFVGLLTHKAVRARGSDIPMLRERRERVLQELNVAPGSHTYKMAVEAFDSLPIEFLFPFEVGQTARAVRRILEATERQEVAVFSVPDPLSRSFFISVILPRPLYDESLRGDLQELLVNRSQATYVDHRSSFLDDEIALIHFFCSGTREVDATVLADLERAIQARVARWEDRFEASLQEVYPPDRAFELADAYTNAFPEEYRVLTSPSDAVLDVISLELLRSGEAALDLVLTRETGTSENRCSRLKVYQSERPYLTDHLPVLGNFGLRVIDATLTEVACADASALWIVTFRIESLTSDDESPGNLEHRVTEGLRRALSGRIEDDALNRLVLAAGLGWREADLLRAYLAYSRQLGSGPDRRLGAQTLLRHPHAARALVKRFRARFDPDLPDGEARADVEAAAAQRVADVRATITAFDEDRVIGLLANLIESSVRTNFFAPAAEGVHEIAFKLDPSGVESMPAPRPFAEIFVHSADMNGIHLRGGPVARGGIRWSDRLQDFRTEILGLMKTQRLKNGLIVPVGAKGGFVLKQRFSDTGAARTEANRQYARFMRLLLRLTDNVAGEAILAPSRVVRHDGDDPYLVVAPDKGTARLSDVANATAEEEGFWLGDAFGSGGSHGYDHRREGITARGAWASVRRHFLELGIEIDEEPFTIIGIGDMSGDVFGNGMLLAQRGRLLAAFNHEHVFLDPSGDPAVAWEERRRLFEQPHSSWRDYDPAKIGSGGGVFDRNAKSIPLSPEIQAMLEVDDRALSGTELIRAILRMPVDLLWNGGIGTYVKASSESHADVGDRANGECRVDASEVRARVVGEGGNLGFTQLARVEYAIRGGRINTDAIDNAGGVDLSDHEVNFKILLAARCAGGTLTREERDEILHGCIDQADRSVLAHCAAQSRCLSLDFLRAKEDPERMVRAAAFLARRARLDWRLEFLPERDELRARSAPSGRAVGYTRPELAVLLGYTKMLIKREFVRSGSAEDPSFRPILHGYFLEALRERFAEEIEVHPLRREITATCLANRVIDQAGVTLVPELVGALGVEVADVIMAYHTVDRLLEADHLRWAIEARALPEPVRLQAGLRLEESVRSAARNRLALERRTRLEPEELAHWTGLVRSLREILPGCLSSVASGRIEKACDELVRQGIARELAFELAILPGVVRALGVVSLVIRNGASLPRVLAVHQHVGEVSQSDWLLDRLGSAGRHNGWNRSAAEALYLQVLEVQLRLTENLIAEGDQVDARARVRETHGARLRHIEELVQQIEGDAPGALAPLTVLSQQIRRLC